MADFTADEIKTLKQQAKLDYLYDRRSKVKKQKSDAIDAINQARNAEIDAANATYNPQIDAINAQIDAEKEATPE